MARYRISHDLDSTWLSLNESDNTYYWEADYKKSFLFENYKKAKAALDTVEVEKRLYGFPYKPVFMKFYDSEEARIKEENYLKNIKLLRQWGEI